MNVPSDNSDRSPLTRLGLSHPTVTDPVPRRETVLNAALSSGLCLDMMIEHMLDRADRGAT